MKKIFLFAATATAVLSATAQTNFSGTWKLQEKQHILGPEYSNALVNGITIQQTKDSLITESLSVGADGNETKSRSSLPMNGSKISSVSASSGRKITRWLTWSADKKTLTITSDIYKQGDENEVELTRVDNWSLSADGKQFALHRKSIETTSENWETKGIFTKE